MKYRKLKPNEKIEIFDEYCVGGIWSKAYFSIGRKVSDHERPYRRPVKPKKSRSKQ